MYLRTRGAIFSVLTLSLLLTFAFVSPFGLNVARAGDAQLAAVCDGGATVSAAHNTATNPSFKWLYPASPITKVGVQGASGCAYYTPAAPADACASVAWNEFGGVTITFSNAAGCDTDVTVLLYKDEQTTTTSTTTTSTTTSTTTTSTTTTTTTTTTTSTTTTTPGGKGCTPGYWKQEQHFGSWREADAASPLSLTPGTKISAVFADNPFSNSTLLEGLNFPDNQANIKGAKATLLRAAIAAVLNASHPTVDYPRDPQAIIDAVNSQLATGTRESILALATALDNDNNLGCTLGLNP